MSWWWVKDVRRSGSQVVENMLLWTSGSLPRVIWHPLGIVVELNPLVFLEQRLYDFYRWDLMDFVYCRMFLVGQSM